MEKMSQIQLAQKVGVSASHISLIFTGHRRPSWRLAKKLADVTGVEPVEWMEGDVAEIRKRFEGEA